MKGFFLLEFHQIKLSSSLLGYFILSTFLVSLSLTIKQPL